MIRAIDVHAHFGDPSGFPQKGKENQLLSLPIEVLEKYCKELCIDKVFLSPMEGLFPFGTHTVTTANKSMQELARKISWVYQWVIVHPEIPQTYAQAAVLLNEKKCVGIKIHPDAHKYRISEYGSQIFEFAAKHHAIVESHSGDLFSMPEDFVAFADRYPEVIVILSHLGNSCDGDVTHHVRALGECRYGNLYTDVSSGKSILNNLVEWAVAEVGADRILFGSDSPLHHVGMMKSRIEYGNLKNEEKKQILYKNAERLFDIVHGEPYLNRSTPVAD